MQGTNFILVDNKQKKKLCSCTRWSSSRGELTKNVNFNFVQRLSVGGASVETNRKFNSGSHDHLGIVNHNFFVDVIYSKCSLDLNMTRNRVSQRI